MSAVDLFRRSPFADLLFANPITYVDIGARGGFEREMLPLSFCADAVGFEPAPEEWARLQAEGPGPWHSRKILPHAIGGTNAKRRLHVPKDPVAASLLPANTNVSAPFGKVAFFTPVDTIEVDTLTLPDALGEAGIVQPDYLKIDAEGAEYEILTGADALLPGLSTLRVEVAFLTFRDGQPVAGELERHLRERGFQMFDLIGPAYWRYHGNVIHPFSDHQHIPYSKGQLAHGDFLFFRSPDSLDLADDGGRKQAVKMAVLAMNFGYFDFAAGILGDERLRGYLAANGIADPLAAVRRLSAVYGRHAYRRALIRHLRGVLTYLRRLPQAFGAGSV